MLVWSSVAAQQVQWVTLRFSLLSLTYILPVHRWATPEHMSDAEYEEVITHLSSFISKHTRGDGTQWKTANDYMGRYLQALGLQHELPRLSVIHVAGTKGKVRWPAHILCLCDAAVQLLGKLNAGLDVRHGGEHPAAMWLQDWLVHLPSPSGCA